MNLRVSRLWHHKYTHPRRAGKFLPGWTLWTRHDGVSRWVFFPNDDAPPLQVRERASFVTEVNRRVIRDLVVIVVAAALVFWFRGA